MKTKLNSRVTTQEMIDLSTMIINFGSESLLRKRLVDLLQTELIHNSKETLKDAIRDKHITEEEISDIISKYKVERLDVAEIFKVKYEDGIKVDNNEGEETVVIMTIEGSPVWKMKTMIESKYGLKVKLAKDLVEEIQKANKNKEDTDYIG